jgi:hypothetical protein
VLAKPLLDNAKGEKSFSSTHPTPMDGLWTKPERVTSHFRRMGTPNVTHYCYSTREILAMDVYAKPSDVGLLMMDGHHRTEQARFDFLAFLDKLTCAGRHIPRYRPRKDEFVLRRGQSIPAHRVPDYRQAAQNDGARSVNTDIRRWIDLGRESSARRRSNSSMIISDPLTPRIFRPKMDHQGQGRQ